MLIGKRYIAAAAQQVWPNRSVAAGAAQQRWKRLCSAGVAQQVCPSKFDAAGMAQQMWPSKCGHFAYRVRGCPKLMIVLIEPLAFKE